MDTSSIIFNMLVQVALIAFVFFVLYIFAWKPFLRYLRDRQNAVMAVQEEARVSKEYATKLSLDAQAKLQEVNEKSDAIIESAEETAKQIVIQERENVQLEVTRKLEVSDKQLEQERARLEEEMQQQAVELASELASKFLSSKASEAQTEKQIKSFLKKLGE